MYLIVFLFLSLNLFANSSLVVQVKQIDFGVTPNEKHLVFLSNGQIVKPSDYDQVERLKRAMFSEEWVGLVINSGREIIRIEHSQNPLPQSLVNPKLLDDNDDEYNPSILKSLDQARDFFNDAKINKKESQCYNRAHVWAYDWRIKYNLYSTKVWIYFTRKYIREFDFEWWFHVAPMVHVITDNEVKERVMDIKYAKGPLSIKQWSNIFIRNFTDCPVVTNYTDQANYPESSYCYLMKSSMYYYQPVDLEMLELKGNQKNRWIEGEVRHAFEEAFEIKL